MVGKGSPSNKGRGSISGVNAVLKAKNGACTPSGKLSKKDPLNKGHLSIKNTWFCPIPIHYHLTRVAISLFEDYYHGNNRVRL